jgi:hypothetical protein
MTSSTKEEEQPTGRTVLLKCLLGGISNATAAVTTNPADVLKVRLQMQNAGVTASSGVQQLGLVQMLQHVWKTEGISGLMAGWQASVMREMTYSAIRMGL